MIPAYSHCQDCGCLPVPVSLLWDRDVPQVLELPVWWCPECKVVLRG